MKTLIFILLAAVSFSPHAVFAHAGHGHDNPLSPGHYLGNPEHVIPLVFTVLLVAYLIGRKLYQSRTKKEERN